MHQTEPRRAAPPIDVDTEILEILHSQSHELEPPLIEEIQLPVRASRVDQGRKRSDELLQPVEV
jgi:hypothetical protein